MDIDDLARLESGVRGFMSLGIRRDFSAVPVLMFHSIGITGIPWAWAHLSEELELFEGILAGLANDGYQSVSLDDLYEHMSESKPLPDRPVVLTFDDGYLDNWVYAVPLLRKYGMRATVYVTPEFVPESGKVRKPPDGAGNGLNAEAVGFMNWAELRAADTEGVLDVQSHALTHTWYFSGPKIVDIHRPAKIYQYPWMSWNVDPPRKPYYLTENQQRAVPWGHPVLEHEKSLMVRRFTPDQGFIEDFCTFVKNEGGEEFFERDDWKGILSRQFPVLHDGKGLTGRTESEEQYAARVSKELARSKEIIESQLAKKVEFLAWPGGGVNEVAANLARSAGYKSWTLSSWQQPGKRNTPGSDPEGIKRITGCGNVYFRDRCIADGGSSWVLRRLHSHQGSLGSKMMAGATKLKWLALGQQQSR